MNDARKKMWKKLIFWIELSILGVTIVAAGTIMIVFSKNPASWGFSPDFESTLVGSEAILLFFFTLFQTSTRYPILTYP